MPGVTYIYARYEAWGGDSANAWLTFLLEQRILRAQTFVPGCTRCSARRFLSHVVVSEALQER